MRFIIFLILMLVSFPVQADIASLDVMAGQMLMAGFRGDHVDAESPIVRDIRTRHLGGVVLFDYDVALGRPDRNVKSPEQVRELIAELKSRADIPLLVAVDQEGGKVQRLKAKWGFPETPSAEVLGQRGPDAARTAGSIIGRTLADVGFTMDYAPVVDVNVDPESPAIGAIGRSFSADPEVVARDAAAFIKGLSSHGVISCLKHFPGHGSASSDSHLGVTDVTRTWSDIELIPYRRLVEQGFDGMIMTAHVFNANLDLTIRPRFPGLSSPASCVTGSAGTGWSSPTTWT
ncbi:glycoside hydrolase family 3 N-terminal domain-containing protein [Salidesulfovibrio brasiliensis]|uniref:glycoside hydrolase family 3 N-terminal domain-containing protein n=1 Tax=Salidesulfovibrio brasiliensis TaxID=221711 RepID=UPI000ACF5C21|nr:glycoside hydrolase family 3 N-terminal domain-containing protein [Salidesulfovibrio brasiliensis]